MGFLKRIFSMGSKKGKKKSPAKCVEPVPRLEHIHEEEEQEAVASRLLRSSSTHYALVSEVNYDQDTIQPLIHPVNSLLRVPRTSNASLSSANSQRSTYTVKVGQRIRHTSTEFPYANGPINDGETKPLDPVTPRDRNRMLGLRQDPSVASLLNMYDEHGCLDSHVFSNTPPSPEIQGRAQTRRTGSTLRQLLGNPSSRSSKPDIRNRTAEGDISWAERFLGEQLDDAASSTSSLGLVTPTDNLFPDNNHLNRARIHSSFSTDNDTSDALVAPIISSMEVELSVATGSDDHEILSRPPNFPYQSAVSPQRASQIFGFLKDKHASGERPLPSLPLPPSRFSDDSHDSESSEILDTFAIPRHNDTRTKKSSPPTLVNPEQIKSESPTWDYIHGQIPSPPVNRTRSQSTSAADILRDGPRLCEVVYSTTPDAHTGRIRGPRPLYSAQLDQIDGKRAIFVSRTTSVDRSNSDCASVDALPLQDPPRAKHSHKRSSRASSTLSLVDFEDEEYIARYPAPLTTTVKKRPVKEVNDKENGSKRAAPGRRTDSKSSKHRNRAHSKPQLPPIVPFTPIRTRSIFRPPKGKTPSPASSSELSPVAQQLMVNLRKKRIYAREQRMNGQTVHLR